MLDEAVPALDGKRVVVALEPLEEPVPALGELDMAAWRLWVASGPQGPIEIDGEPEVLDHAGAHERG